MKDQIGHWVKRDPDPDTVSEVQALLDADDQEGLKSRFGQRLAFGTAGLRGIIGAGPNRMNRLLVRETSAGLAKVLLERIPGAAERGIVVGYDGRRLSDVFARDAASVFAAHGINVHFSTLSMPTPTFAYAVRAYGAAAGIVITASHNPPAYNGYKVYWGNGAQIISPVDSWIAEAIDEASRSEIPYRPFAEARQAGLIMFCGPKLLDDYLRAVTMLTADPDCPGRRSVNIVYTPLHGVGAIAVESALARAGFEHVHTVSEQREPNGAFPTVDFPNPEEPGATDMLLALAREHDADLALANDPDADRLAAIVKTPDGAYQPLTGNEIGTLLGADCIASASGPSAVGTTIVSSRLLSRMAEAAGVDYFETLTGFKWIANQAIELEAKGVNFLFGYEEALGYTIGNLVRDKDGVSALVAFAMLASRLGTQGETILDALESIYRKHGFYASSQKSISTEGAGGVSNLNDAIRAKIPTHIGGYRVLSVQDLAAGTVTRSGESIPEQIELPKSDVLVFDLESNARVVVRPSGTEPKVKCYYEIATPFSDDQSYAEARENAFSALAELSAAHQADIAEFL